MKGSIVFNLCFITSIVQGLSRDQKEFLLRRKEFCLDLTMADPSVVENLEGKDYKIQLHKSDLDRFTHCLLTRSHDEQNDPDASFLKINSVPYREPSEGKTMDVPL